LNDGGGMNVYVRALASALARAGVECDVLTRADAPGLDPIVEVEPGFRVVHLDAGPAAAVSKHELVELIDLMTQAALAYLSGPNSVDVIHANYWISGAVGHKRVNKEFIEKTLIPLPPLSVQQKIVAKLDAIFAEIDKASAAAEAVEAIVAPVQSFEDALDLPLPPSLPDWLGRFSVLRETVLLFVPLTLSIS
jgi:hypothetical protein